MLFEPAAISEQKRLPKTLLRILSALCFFTGLTFTTQAQSSVTFAWDPSPSQVAGYRIYQGTAPGNYSQKFECGATTMKTVSGLIAGTRYYFAVVAYDAMNLESDFSNEVQYTPVSTAVPGIVLSWPVNGASYTAPASISLAAAVTPNGQTISKVQFFNGATLLGEDVSAPYGMIWNNVPAGIYSLRARALYGASGAVDSYAASVAVSVARPPDSNPSFAATSGSITAPFAISGDAIYQPSQTSLSAGGRAVYDFTVDTTGEYIVKAEVVVPNEAQNSFFVNIDGEPTDPVMIWDIPPGSTRTVRTVSWRGTGPADANRHTQKVFTLSAGAHQLIVRGREANAQLGTITIVPVPPSLQMRASGNKVILSWPAYATNYTLQATANLSNPGAWVNVPDRPGLVGQQNTVTNSIQGPSRFYRLIK